MSMFWLVALDLRDARCVSFRMCAIILLISNVRHEKSVELSNFSQQRIIAVVLCVVGTCNDNHPSRIHPLTGNKIVRMWLAISRVLSFVVDELRIRAWTEMKLSPADGHVEGVAADCLLSSADLPHLAVSHLPGDKETQK